MSLPRIKVPLARLRAAFARASSNCTNQLRILLRLLRWERCRRNVARSYGLSNKLTTSHKSCLCWSIFLLICCSIMFYDVLCCSAVWNLTIFNRKKTARTQRDPKLRAELEEEFLPVLPWSAMASVASVASVAVSMEELRKGRDASESTVQRCPVPCWSPVDPPDIWPLLDTFGRFWPLLDTFGRFWTLLDTFGHITIITWPRLLEQGMQGDVLDSEALMGSWKSWNPQRFFGSHWASMTNITQLAPNYDMNEYVLNMRW